MRRILSCCLVGFSLIATHCPDVKADTSWPEEFVDPGAANYGPADLMLPMPCGGSMAFQRVDVPSDQDSPLADRPLRLGAADQTSGYLDYFVRTYLRGAFTDGGSGNSFYYIGRYELTADQFAAIVGECREPSIRGRLPKLSLSWFDAVDATRRYSEWLRQEAVDHLPHEDGYPAFARLPTETEWEFAVRGGVKVDAADFAARQFPMDAQIDAFAWHQGVSRNEARPIGLRKPNPLGLFDVYGNAEEHMLEPFRMNALGRRHGQVGGIVTRGGSFRTVAGSLYSARRTEWPLYKKSDGAPSDADTFGVRLVLSTHVSVSDDRVAWLQEGWTRAFEAELEVIEDPIVEITKAIEDETDERRRSRLQELRELLRDERRVQEENAARALRASFLNGAFLIQVVRDRQGEIDRANSMVALLMGRVSRERDQEKRREIAERRDAILARIEEQKPFLSDALLSYSQILEWALASQDVRQFATVRDAFRTELRSSGQEQLLGLVESHYEDYLEFRTRPDMSRRELLDLVVKR